jgi:threonine dehydratase
MVAGLQVLMSRITIEHIYDARARIDQIVRRTPLDRSRWLSEGREVYLKLECLQTTGSFKLRGAAAKLTSLSDQELRRGILTVSAGNHGLAVAHCAELLGANATIIVPKSAARAKVEAIRRHRVNLIEYGDDYDQAERYAREMETTSGMTFVSPYNDVQVIAGQGTAALEILEDCADVDTLVVPVGGGGLLAGVAVAAKTLKPQIKVYGVEPLASPTLTSSLEAGQVVAIQEDETIADGLAGNIEPGSITFPLIQQFVDEVILVSEDSIRTAIVQFVRNDRLILEGAAAAALAALSDRRLQSGRIAAILTGRNITFEVLRRVMLET